MIAFSTDRDGLPAIWLKQINGGGEAPLTTGPDLNARFSPDGSQVLFVRDEGINRNLYRIAVVGGHQRKLIDDVIEADWSPDGSQVAFLRLMPVDKDNLTIIGIADVQTGGEREIARIENRPPPPASPMPPPTWAPRCTGPSPPPPSPCLGCSCHPEATTNTAT